jgi:hypothetical protein
MYRLSPVERDNRERLQKAQSISKATGKSKALNYLKCIVSPVEIDKRERLQKAYSNSKATSKSKALNYLKCIVSLPRREIRERGYIEEREFKKQKIRPLFRHRIFIGCC